MAWPLQPVARIVRPRAAPPKEIMTARNSAMRESLSHSIDRLRDDKSSRINHNGITRAVRAVRMATASILASDIDVNIASSMSCGVTNYRDAETAAAAA